MGTHYVVLRARLPNVGQTELRSARVTKSLTFGELEALAAQDAAACVLVSCGREERGAALEVAVRAGLPAKARAAWTKRLRSLAELAWTLDGTATLAVIESADAGVWLDAKGERAMKPAELRAFEREVTALRDEMEERARPRTPRIPEPTDAPPKALAAAVEALRGPDKGKAAAAEALLAATWRPGWQLVAAQLDRDHLVGGPIGQQAIAALFRLGSDVAWDALASVLERLFVQRDNALIQTMWAFEWLRSAPEGYAVDPRWIAAAERIVRERPKETLRGEHKLFLARFAPKKRGAAGRSGAASKGRVGR